MRLGDAGVTSSTIATFSNPIIFLRMHVALKKKVSPSLLEEPTFKENCNLLLAES
jgi:hypothetical protein